MSSDVIRVIFSFNFPIMSLLLFDRGPKRDFFFNLWKITPQTWADKFVEVEGYKRVGNNYKNSYRIYQKRGE